MCGRYSLAAPTSQITEAFEIQGELDFETKEMLSHKRYNIAPSQFVPIIIENDDNTKIIKKARFGFIPSWWAHSKETFTKPPLSGTFNARDDKIFQSGYWKKSIQHHRCLLPASGFYEWEKTSTNAKIPYYFKMKDENKLLALGGIFSIWKKPDEYKFIKEDITEICTTAIITTPANKNTKAIGHERHPFIVEKEFQKKWLNTGTSEDEIKSIIKPCSCELMVYYQVSTAVNSTRTDSSELINEISWK
ncbi:MAG: SOS response-associated peptidase [Spirochaetia bacterium]|nr:SOS response-associated peptidase [Spirochaetia bacterium]